MQEEESFSESNLPVLKPGSTGGDVVGGALALGLDEDGGVNNVLAVPGGEAVAVSKGNDKKSEKSNSRLEDLKTVRGGGDLDLNLGAVGRRGLESLLSLVVALNGELLALGSLELELLAVGTLDGVGEGVEGERTTEDHGGDHVGGGDEGVGSGVGVVASGEVTVVRRDDG